MTDATTETRKPRIAIMGEFSAGKSTLSNLLLGTRALPEKVTATRLPPVWITSGVDEPFRIGMDGEEYPVSLDRLEDVPLDDTRFVMLNFVANILDRCDLIDFPGISDPNMASEVWERMLDEVDAVLWCTHATQAWRQSESAVWAMIPEHVRSNSLLLITRFDKLTNDNDRMRVRTRVARETKGLFAAICPISLTQALKAEEGDELWDRSGAKGLYAAIDVIIDRIEQGVGATPEPEAQVQSSAEVCELHVEAEPAEPVHILPRRVKPGGTARTPRPSAGSENVVDYSRMMDQPPTGNRLERLRADFRQAEENSQTG